ncbi:NAD(P)H-dependent oxidoreductase [Thalassotalea psychrophila]|uniref:NAD(P)H-dependent oxidoreductase n=1 Tax=Thalassotalea psychrophila TaxID=3065647 RepID=A0ABY9TNL3_9GAMM|nr:NAD(P)H-dependent oxidoreductase [Colwelliaceae bacterium SQ149]
MNNTVAILSSARAHGNTEKLLNSFTLNTNINVDIIDLSKYSFSEYDYNYNNQDDDFLPLMEKILSYEKIIFASPVYWYAVTPTMKKFLDRISDLLDLPHLLDSGRRLRGKTAFVVCSSASTQASNSFISAFKETFEYLGMYYGGFLHANCADGYQENNYVDDLNSFRLLFK